MVQDIIVQDREAATTFNKANLNGLPLREYLDHTVIPVLVEGLKIISKERYFLLVIAECCRPPNPTEFLGVYLLKNSHAASK